MEKKIKIAIIGMGKMGNNHYNTVMNNPDVELVAVVDPISPKATHKNVNSMLIDSKPQCAIISSPTTTHLLSAGALIEEGVHLLIEKPVVSNPSESELIKKAEKRNTSRIAVGHVERFNPAIQALKRDIDTNSIVDCYSKRVGPYPTRIGDVGVTLDLAVHDIDLIRFVTEKNIFSISGQRNHVFRNTREDNITISLGIGDMSPTITSTINASWTYPFRERSIRILTDKFYYLVDLMAMTVKKYSSLGNSKYSVENLYVSKEDALQSQLKSFLNYAIMNEDNHIATLDDGIESLRVAWEAKR